MSNSINLLSASLARVNASEEAEPTPRPEGWRRGPLEPPSAAQLYGPHGLLANKEPPGGAGAARVVKVDGETLRRADGPLIDLGRLPLADIPVRERTDLITKRLEEQRARTEERKTDKRERDGRPGDAAQAAGRYLDVERGALGIPTTLRPDNPYLPRQREEPAVPLVRRTPGAPGVPSEDDADER